MDFEYTDEQKAIQKMMADFSNKELAPGAEERDRTGKFPYDLYKKIGKVGVLGTIFPEKYGGSEGDTLSWYLIIEEVSRVDSSLGVTMQVSVASGRRVLVNGTEEWCSKLIPPIAKGEVIGAAAITEPNAGSDVQSIRTTAILEGDEWVINGTKAFITNAGTEITSFAIVMCLTDPSKREFSVIIVPNGTPGYNIMPAYQKMGWRSSDTHELVFENCRVPRENLLGKRGRGLARTLEALTYGRLSLSSNALGLSRICLEESLKYSKGRVQFGRPISKFQHVQGLLVDMAMNIELGRLMRDKAAWLYDQKKPNIKEAHMAKLFCTETAVKAASVAIQIHGGMGFMDECPVSRYYRDCRVLTIGDGTSEIQKYILAKELGC